jgi:hypothetical protein
MPAKRFEILDSLRGESNVEMIEHADRLVDAIKRMYMVNYSDSRRQIANFELMCVPVPKQIDRFVFLQPCHHFFIRVIYVFCNLFLCTQHILILKNWTSLIAVILSTYVYLFSVLIAVSLCSKTSNCGMEVSSLLFAKTRCQE